MNRNIELLAPAGNYECFIAALNAGADAVYLGGKDFGARSFAGNFEEDEIIKALHYAHLLNKKIYLTLNTLIKEKEWNKVYPFLKNLYAHGLDGVIIQDIGLIPYLKEFFPLMEIHISTQMTVTSIESAKYLYDLGVSRIVPARELTMDEIKQMKREVPVELETFIHGALCYCYSGQCLFSSFLGGRSGNRGKCAQTCRLPYQVMKNHVSMQNKQPTYPLSLKDMCTVSLLPQLIESGIDSFKIEGRMKSSEYVAGVTSIYRKYIDLYIQDGMIKVTKEDNEILNKLYVRSSLGTGYYNKMNGKDMVSFYNPSYSSINDEMTENIRKKYCEKVIELPIDISIYLEPDKPSKLTASFGNISIDVLGEKVSVAKNRPLSKADIEKQLIKTGNYIFKVNNIKYDITEDCFMTIKQLNEIRRVALEKLEQKLLEKTFRNISEIDTDTTISASPKMIKTKNQTNFSVSVMNINQLKVLKDYNVSKIYIPADLIIHQDISLQDIDKFVSAKINRPEIFLSLPRIIRNKDQKYLSNVANLLNSDMINGVLIKDLDELNYIKNLETKIKKDFDHNLYVWNQTSLNFLKKEADSICAPLELSRYELNDLNDNDIQLIVYGHLPMMVSANCIMKTTDNCNKSNNSFNQSIFDRYKKEHMVFCNCIHCYNEIYNSLPLSLHNEMKNLENDGYYNFRLDFTFENPELEISILQYFMNGLYRNKETFPIKEYTTGHVTKGAL